MADAAAHHKDVPDCVIVRHSLECEEQNSYCVEQPSSKQPHNAGKRHRRKLGLDGDQRLPAHCYIENRGYYPESLCVKQFPNDAERTAAPHERKQNPAPQAAQVDKRERRISSSDEQVDCSMIQCLENSF